MDGFCPKRCSLAVGTGDTVARDIFHKNSVKWWYVTTFFAIFAKNVEYELGRDIRGLACFAASVGKG